MSKSKQKQLFAFFFKLRPYLHFGSEVPAKYGKAAELSPRHTAASSLLGTASASKPDLRK